MSTKAIVMTIWIALLMTAMLFFQYQESRKQSEKITVEVSKSRLLEFTKDMDAVMREGKVVPRLKDEKVECLLIEEQKPGGFFEYAGFLQGDCVISVNGERVDSPMAAMMVYGSLAKATQVELVIERNGVVTPMTVKINP